MADFENDPAADFLAREHAELGDLGDDLGFASSQNYTGDADVDDQFGMENEGEIPVDGETTTNGPSDGFGAIRVADRQRQEPEKIRLWRIEFEERVKRKDAEEEVRCGEWQEIAAKELEDWHKRNLDQQEKTAKLNREQEEVFVRERDDTDPGLEWERVARLCEFNPKYCKQQRDVSRMRAILLQLKTQPLTRS